MDPAIHQSLAFVCLLVIGLLLKFKIREQQELRGIKTLILAVALPATIFVALLKIQLSGELLALPFVGLSANLLLFGLSYLLIVPLLVRHFDGARKRTILLLLPSFAPGLSCFPFIIEYLGDETLANAALVDVGNKVFVLLLLYLLAMRWYYQRASSGQVTQVGAANRLKDLAQSLFREPVNAVIILALLLLAAGYRLENLPLFIQDFVGRAHALTTGMVLIFIGAAIKIKRSEAQSILSILLLRSGLTFFLTALILYFTSGMLSFTTALLLVIFPQSSCSFWPLAHMSAVEDLERQQGVLQGKRTFDLQTGLNILALSLPFSSLLILAICSTGKLFTGTLPCFTLGVIFVVLGLLLRFGLIPLKTFMHGYRMDVAKIRSEKQESFSG